MSLARAEYWEKHAEREPLPSMKEPCHDCAMTCGFYKPYADELIEQPREIIEKVLKSWWCHNHGNRACKGAEDYVREKLLSSPSERPNPLNEV